MMKFHEALKLYKCMKGEKPDKPISNKKYTYFQKIRNMKRSSVFIKKDNTKNKSVKGNYKLDNRIAYYKYINNILTDINGNECLESKVFEGNNGYTLNNTINLVKKIGSESKYGVIFLTHIVNNREGLTIASKVMPNNSDNNNEIKIMKYITDEILLKNRSKHFAFMYKYAICKELHIDYSRRIVCVNELANGDLKMLMTNRELLYDNELIMNLLFQCFISIGTFQNIIGYIHYDTHHGNFLYQTNDETGYYQYSFNGKKYYLKSCGYNIMIYDFGLARQMKYNKFSGNVISTGGSSDYIKINQAFMCSKFGWGIYDDLPKDEINNKIINIKSVLKRIVYKNENDFFEKIIENVLIPFSPKRMLVTERPKNVINKIAFDIN